MRHELKMNKTFNERYTRTKQVNKTVATGVNNNATVSVSVDAAVVNPIVGTTKSLIQGIKEKCLSRQRQATARNSQSPSIFPSAEQVAKVIVPDFTNATHSGVQVNDNVSSDNFVQPQGEVEEGTEVNNEQSQPDCAGDGVQVEVTKVTTVMVITNDEGIMKLTQMKN